MPTPASESADAFCSPVPAYSVCDAASSVSIPIAFVPNEPETYVQDGFDASASSVRQTPRRQPAQRRQLPAVHAGSIASALTRPDAM